MKEINEETQRMLQYNMKMPDIYPVEANIYKAIAKGEEIKERRRMKIEVAAFLGTAVALIGLFLAGFVKIGESFMLLYAVIMFFLAPLLLIPIASKSMRRDEA